MVSNKARNNTTRNNTTRNNIARKGKGESIKRRADGDETEVRVMGRNGEWRRGWLRPYSGKVRSIKFALRNEKGGYSYHRSYPKRGTMRGRNSEAVGKKYVVEVLKKSATPTSLLSSTSKKGPESTFNLKDGVYSLSPRSHIGVHRNMLRVSPQEWKQLHHFMLHTVKRSPNPRNPATFLKRRQCTFVMPNASEYEFGQYNETFRQCPSQWNPVAKRVIDMVREIAPCYGVKDVSVYNGVHINLYNDGSVGVLPHTDKEQSMMEGLPIFSFTLLSDPSLPRPFSIYTEDAVKLHDILLRQGDLLVMYGQMQREFKHGIEKSTPPSKYKNLARINLTVRAFKPL